MHLLRVKTFFRLSPILLALSALPAGAGPDASTPAKARSNPQQERIPVEVIGEVGGAIGQNLLTRVAPVQQAPKAVVIGEGKWSQADRSEMQTEYKAGMPIALINADAQEIKALRQTLDLKAPTTLPTGVGSVDAYAVERDANGQQHELIVLSPMSLPKATVVVSSGDERHGTQYTTREEDAPYDDSKALQVARTAQITAWLKDMGEQPSQPAPSKAMPRKMGH